MKQYYFSMDMARILKNNEYFIKIVKHPAIERDFIVPDQLDEVLKVLSLKIYF